MNFSLGSLVKPRIQSDESRRLQGALQGDRHSFDEIVRELEPELRIFLRRKIGNGDADDVLQDVWIAAWNARGSFDRRSRFKTWLYGIALNKCRDFYRSAAGNSKREIALADGGLEIAVVEEEFQRTELQQLIKQVLDGLSGTQREVLELYYFAELSLPEIGQLLGRNLNTVKYQFYRAHTEAAERLKPALEIATGIKDKHDEYRL